VEPELGLRRCSEWPNHRRLRNNRSRPAVLCAAGAETLTTEHRPARRWFEGHTVGLAARIADNFKLFAFRSPSLSLSTKVLAAGITAGFTTLRMAEATLAVVVLFSFGKREGISALGASNFKIWHRCLPRKTS
jgi:hypothetical protein